MNDDALLAKFKSTGDVNSSFGGGDGYVLIDGPDAGRRNLVKGSYVGTDGKILLAGDYKSTDESDDAYACRLNADGSLDETFGILGYYSSDAWVETDVANALAVLPTTGE
ncbi:MAG: delta-60 repeat domain-containing protein [Saprospirales bacterium]|nr:delta-60 repeat domain-containing protein [Saprospirales bacterium]